MPKLKSSVTSVTAAPGSASASKISKQARHFQSTENTAKKKNPANQVSVKGGRASESEDDPEFDISASFENFRSRTTKKRKRVADDFEREMSKQIGFIDESFETWNEDARKARCLLLKSLSSCLLQKEQLDFEAQRIANDLDTEYTALLKDFVEQCENATLEIREGNPEEQDNTP